MILKLRNNEIEIEDFYFNEFVGENKHVGLKVIKAAIKYELDVLFTSRIGEISFYMLKDNFVDIFKIEDNLARLDYERYEPSEKTETAMEKCPTGVIVYRGKSAPAPRAPGQKPAPAKA